MENYKIISLKDYPDLIPSAAEWFSGKWNVPLSAYTESMNEAVRSDRAYPDWVVVVHDGKIIAGLGVIENDFHKRTDLCPNVCAVYVQEEFRRKGIAGKMLCYIVEKMKARGVSPVYLLTDHTSFYERYGWEFFCMAEEDGGGISRLYIHK